MKTLNTLSNEDCMQQTNQTNQTSAKKSQANTITAKTGQINSSGKSYEGSSDTTTGGSFQKGNSEGSAESSSDNQSSSLTETVKSQFSPEAKKNFDVVSKQVTQFISDAKSYINENPKEAAMVAVSLALGAWTVMNTAPGKKVFNGGQRCIYCRVLRNGFRNLLNPIKKLLTSCLCKRFAVSQASFPPT